MHSWATFLSFAFLGIAIFYMRTSTQPSNRNASSLLARHTLLVVMVKNEAAVIERMLTSFKHVGANYLFLCDTGSNDTTISITERVWQKNYKVYKTNFVNFEVTRNDCNLYARMYAQKLRSLGVQLDYVLLADADYTLAPTSAGFAGGGGTLPEYDVNTIQIYGTPHNALPMLIKYGAFDKCKYRLWTHEFLDCTSPAAPRPASGGAGGGVGGGAQPTTGYFNAFHYIDHADGHSRPEKLTRDIALLKQWLDQINATDLRPRALYYLARAQEDSGLFDEALQTYERHNKEQTFTNYLFYAKYRMALISLKTAEGGGAASGSFENIESLFLAAFAEHDGYFRREVPYWLARYFRSRGMMNKCILYASAGMHLPSIDFARMPLFLEMYVYDWAIEEELAFCLKYKGRVQESREHYKHILEVNAGRLDEVTLERISSSFTAA